VPDYYVGISRDKNQASTVSWQEIIGTGIVIAVICALSVFVLPWRSTGFDDSWDRPPNATPASTVCVKRPIAHPAN
jgi:hypothetical protein